MSSLQGYVDRTSNLSPPLALPHLLLSKGRVLLVLQDGRAIVVRIPCTFVSHLTPSQGVLAGYDQKSNVVLSDSKERVYSMEEGVEEIPLGLYLVKGDMMYVASEHSPSTPLSPSILLLSSTPRVHHVPYSSILIGEIDEERDRTIDLSTIRADPIPPIRY
jgi:U6 snRNA-associated Sm-like protein LSm8